MFQDLRYAIRTLFRSPGFTLTAALTLALGIGVTSLMFSIVNAVLLRPLPYPDPDRLLLVFNVNTTDPSSNTMRLTALDFDDYRARTRTFESMAGHIGTGFTFSGGREPELVIGQMVSPDFFKVFGVAPAIGRTFNPDEFSLGRETVVVLSHRLWQRRFGGSPAAIGSTTTVNGRPFTIVGVMPPSFDYPGPRYELWAPLPLPRSADLPPANRSAHYLQVIGRLKPSVSYEQATSDIVAIASGLATQYPDSNAKTAARTVRLEDFTVRNVKTPLYVLLGAVGLVVLIACANVTNLLLARATSRYREVAIRQALGAGRGRLVRQFLVETAALYGLGAAGALALASWGTAIMISLGPDDIPRLADASLDGRVMGVTLLLSLVTAMAFGLAPALQGSSADPADALRTGGRSASAGRARQRVRTVLVVAEVALSVVLLIGAGLALHSLAKLTAVDPGFDADGQLTFSVVLPPRRYPDSASMTAVADRIAERVAGIPGVAAAGWTTHLPLSGQNMENGFQVDGYVPREPGEVPIAGMRGVSPKYFAALGARLKSGRAFTDADRRGSQPVAIVNEAFARRYWSSQDPIGRRLQEYGGSNSRTVIGVIADVKHSGPAEDARPEVSLPYSQLDPGFMTTWSRGIYFVVRTASAGVAVGSAVRTAVTGIDSEMSLNEMQSLAALASDAVSAPRFRTVLLGTFAALAIALASIGVFGVLSYFVIQRTREIGIRVALGARTRDIMRSVVASGVTVVLVGVASGLAASVAVAGLLGDALFGVSTHDIGVLSLVTAVLLGTALVANGLPARRAARIDPMRSLRTD